MEDEMKVLIIAIGKCRKNSPEAQIIAEYIKRSGWEVVVKEKDNATQAEEAKFLQEKGLQNMKLLLSQIKKLNPIKNIILKIKMP